MKPASALTIGLALAGLLAASNAFASLQLHYKSGCVACHMVDKKLVGPSYKDIAAKYKGRADAVPYLSSRVRKGGPGNWGTVPMAPNDVKKLNDAELKTLMTWILATP
ncbi:MAG: c-type cytochrome [Rubrivivax sp.]|nr:c-type cytochrome [Rubrivivax sp.]